MAPPTLSEHLEIAAAPHRDPVIARTGFDLSHPYLEQCWAPSLGPSAVLLLRRLPILWHEREPAVVPVDELARSLGLGASRGAHSRFNRTLRRIVDAHLAVWAEPGIRLDVYLELPPLPPSRLARLPSWSRQAHDRLLDQHLHQLARSANRSPAAAITARLDQLQRPRTHNTAGLGR